MKTKSRFTPTVLRLLLSTLLATPVLAQNPLDRSVLPVPEPKREPMTELDVPKAKAPPRFEVTSPKGAPNVVIALVDEDTPVTEEYVAGVKSRFTGQINKVTVDLK